jgi:hypothetical protein
MKTELGLVYDTDPPMTKEAPVPKQKKPGEPPSESQRKK